MMTCATPTSTEQESKTMVMTRDELAALEEKVREAAAEVDQMRSDLLAEKIKTGNAEFAERGIRIGDVVEVISDDFDVSRKIRGKGRVERGIFQGFECSSLFWRSGPLTVSPRIAKMKKDGTAAARGEVRIPYGADVRPVSDQR